MGDGDEGGEEIERERGREGSACLENSGRGKVGGTGGLVMGNSEETTS